MTRSEDPGIDRRALAGVRVVELGQLMAGPFAGTILAYHGAEVIKVEPPGAGDPIRDWRHVDGGTSLWWRSLARNKRCVTLDLRGDEGRAIARRLILRADVLLENFRPGTLESWGLVPARLLEENPRLVVVRVSGFGQTGPWAGRPGFAAVCEAAAGLRHLTGVPGEPPVRANLSLGDSVAGLHAALGTLLALRARERDGRGQVVDVAITEAVLNLLESVIPEAARGVVRGPSGTTITGVVPSNLYPCAGGEAVVIGANGVSLFRRLMEAAGRSDLARDPRLESNTGRVERQAEIDEAIAAWTRTLPAAEVEARLVSAAVPCAAIATPADLLANPHYRARGLFERFDLAGEELVLPALAPRLDGTPGHTDFPGPDLGAHNREVYAELGIDAAALAGLRARGVV
jgi:crotonobetainyl-CoA:carnitine CoA-transferase CaiB-like acyl-CoA transferase